MKSSPAGIGCGAACSASFARESSVVLTAAPRMGSFFAGWRGGVCAGRASCAVTMSAARSVTAVFTQRIIVTAPNGGESWARGSSVAVSWSYAGSVGSQVKIALLKGGKVNRVIASAVAVGSGGVGSHRWEIPAGQTPGTDYTIRVTSTANSNHSDTSDASFTIR